MNKQFTPGPWVLGLEEPEQNQHTEDDYANARLIAADPEMFELLEKFCEQCNKQNIEGLVPEYEQAITLLQRVTNPSSCRGNGGEKMSMNDEVKVNGMTWQYFSTEVSDRLKNYFLIKPSKSQVKTVK